MPSYLQRVRIDHNSPEPYYLQLADIIRKGIDSGEYPLGRPIPSIERIRQETGLAVMTIRKAIGLLAAEGAVRIIPGKGTYVRGPENRPE